MGEMSKAEASQVKKCGELQKQVGNVITECDRKTDRKSQEKSGRTNTTTARFGSW